ncbi:MAG: hypothetical protein Q4G60_00195 [bacterium]|nr:hypothetical protein [bacterium]
MRKTYFISFFLCVITLGLVYFSAYFYSVFVLNDHTIPLETEVISEEEHSEAVLVDTNDTPSVKVNTKLVIESYDLNDYTLSIADEELPMEYIGLTRDELIAAISDYCSYPTEEDISAGFESMQLISFSEDKVIVRKSYKPVILPEQFYLMAENHYVSVYYDDRETIYMYTGIALDSLPENVQREIVSGKFIPSIHELYGFLETYSS